MPWIIPGVKPEPCDPAMPVGDDDNAVPGDGKMA
jgi:hypothetical protein